MTATVEQPAETAIGQDERVRGVTFIRFFLEFTEPGGVTVPGRPGHEDDVPWGPERAHLLLDTDPWGRPQLPGTSLAGALREMTRVADGADTEDLLFGHLLPADTGGTEVDARASLVWVLGSRPAGLAGSTGQQAATETRIRASTAISRASGAALSGTLRVEEMVAPGSRFEVFLRWDNAPGTGLSHFLELLPAWRPLIGRGTSRGRGRCKVAEVYSGTLRLDEPEGLHRWLTLSGPDLARAVATNPVTAPAEADLGSPRTVAAVDGRITGPLRVGSGKPAPRTGSQGQEVAPMFREGNDYLLPGTGLKGLLRSRAEYILRSVGLHPEPCLDQRCASGSACWTCRVFGFGGRQDPASPAAGARAQVRVTDAIISGPKDRRRQHVAIDRFTGGAQDSLLYTVEALEEGTFTIQVEALAGDLPAQLTAEIRAVLRLVFEDLNDGLTGIGAGVARGYGSVRLDLAAAEQRAELPTVSEARAQLARMVAASTPAEGK